LLLIVLLGKWSGGKGGGDDGFEQATIEEALARKKAKTCFEASAMIWGLFSPLDSEFSLRLCFLLESVNARNPHDLVDSTRCTDIQGIQRFSTGSYCKELSFIRAGWRLPQKWWCRMQAWQGF
jgi:hypothetical protein